MKFSIQHHTRYQYSSPVQLGPHVLRFHPRGDGAQRVLDYHLNVTPTPVGTNGHLDLEGNQLTQVWFEGNTECFEVVASMMVETLRHDPYHFILNFDAVTLPIDYSSENQQFIQAYLNRIQSNHKINKYADDLARDCSGNSMEFLTALTEKIHVGFKHVHRDAGDPQTPQQTLELRQGACRDLAVFFIDCCRSQGIAARFASGYQKGDLASNRRFLHAWPEAYLPGAGWIGFDPTHGQIIGDTHVTVAASASPANTLALSGGFGSDAVEMVDSTLNYNVVIRLADF